MADSTQDGAEERMSAAELAAAAKESIEALTSHSAESVSALEWNGDGDSWVVAVDVCELRRIPNTTDVMATYEVRLDQQGKLLGYKRTRRFVRGAAEEG
jgi:Gas vesicle synthesis protein GvpO